MNDNFENREMTDEELEVATAPDSKIEETPVDEAEATEVENEPEKVEDGDFYYDTFSKKKLRKPKNLRGKAARDYANLMKELAGTNARARSIKLPEIWDRALRMKAMNEGKTEAEILTETLVEVLTPYCDDAYRMALRNKNMTLD